MFLVSLVCARVCVFRFSVFVLFYVAMIASRVSKHCLSNTVTLIRRIVKTQ